MYESESRAAKLAFGALPCCLSMRNLLGGLETRLAQHALTYINITFTTLARTNIFKLFNGNLKYSEPAKSLASLANSSYNVFMAVLVTAS